MAAVAANRRTRADAAYADASSEEERYTIATRWWGRGERCDYDFDVGVQRGHVGTKDIRVWYVRTDNSWMLSRSAGRPRADLRFSIGSGDTQTGDGVLGTFSPLFIGFSPSPARTSSFVVLPAEPESIQTVLFDGSRDRYMPSGADGNLPSVAGGANP